MNEQELEFEIVPSLQDTMLSACVGVRVRHKATNLTVESTTEKNQYANKVVSIETLQELLVKERYNMD